MENLDKMVTAGAESFDDIADERFREMLKAAAFSLLQQLRDDFIKNDCMACGGNWTRMILSGIKRRWPEFWDSLPNKNYDFLEAVDIVDNKLIADYLQQNPISD